MLVSWEMMMAHDEEMQIRQKAFVATDFEWYLRD